MGSQTPVVQLVLRVEHEEDEVEPAQQRVRQLDVLDDGLLLVPLGVDRVGGGQDGRAGVELANHARLGNAQRLLLHHLVEDGPGRVGHLVKLVDAADAVVGEDEGAPVRHRRSVFPNCLLQKMHNFTVQKP